MLKSPCRRACLASRGPLSPGVFSELCTISLPPDSVPAHPSSLSTTTSASAKRPRAETIPGQGVGPPSASQAAKRLKPGAPSFLDEEAAEAENDPEADLDDVRADLDPRLVPEPEADTGPTTTKDEGPRGVEGITQTTRKAKLSATIKKERFQERYGHLSPEDALRELPLSC